MNKRPGHVDVTVETGYCSFCGRPRNLRREAHQLGSLVRTIVTCETCHRTLSSTIGVATEEPAPAEAPANEPVEAAAEPEAKPKRAPAKRATKAAAAKATTAKTPTKAPAKRATTKKK
jgi:hypothetical protein